MVNYTQIPTNKLVAAGLVCYLWHLYQYSLGLLQFLIWFIALVFQ